MHSTTIRKKVIVFFVSALFLVSQSFSQGGTNVGINTATPVAALDVNGDIIIRTAELTVADGITLALDVNTIRFSNYRVTGPTANFIIAGISAGIDGRLVTLFNRSGFMMQLNNEDAAAAVTDMIVTGTGTDIIIPNKGIVNLQYDGIEQKWIIRSSNKGGVSGGGGFWDASGNDIFNINTGNVGIGTNAPLEKLTIQTLNNINGISHRGEGGNILSTRMGGSSAGIGTFSNTHMRLICNSNNAMFIDALNGNIGIGTDFPYEKLTVQTLNNVNGISHRGEGGNILSTRMGGSSAGIGTFSNTHMRLICNSNNAMFIDALNGNIGVGTDFPFEKLTVQTLNNTNGISHRGEGGRILSTHMGGSSAGIGTFSNINMRIFANGISRIFIAEATGNVGIGTDNPTYKLSVLGNIRSTEVVVENGWADYVFDKNYKLPLLSEVEKFIQQNKHLPNIPSAKEVAENGLYLGDTQKRMMEKIEELTLYLIEQQKQIKALEQEMEKIRKNNLNNF